MTHPATVVALASLGVSLCTLALVAVMLYQQHQLRRVLLASTPAQLLYMVKELRQQVLGIIAILGPGGAREIRGRLDDHEQRITRLEEGGGGGSIGGGDFALRREDRG